MDRQEIDADLREIDHNILDMLEKYPCTRKHIANELDVSGEYVYQRIRELKNLGLVEVIHDGYYETPGWRQKHDS